MRLLPLVAREQKFALKGGTAINLFARDLPRLSVDVDLTYLPLDYWHRALAAIEEGLGGIADDIEREYQEHPSTRRLALTITIRNSKFQRRALLTNAPKLIS